MHRDIINSFKAIGYSTGEAGLCHGLCLGWIESCLVNEEDTFESRITKIKDLGVEIHRAFKQVKEKKGKALTKSDLELFDIVGFYDRLTLFHAPRQYSSVFNVNGSLNQEDIEIISAIASSETIRKQGGLAKIYSESQICSKDEIKQYLDELSVLFEGMSLPKNERIGILLGSGDHSQALSYVVGVGWKFMDINQYPPKSFMISNTSELASKITSGFELPRDSSYLTFHASLITTGNNPHLGELEATLNQWKYSHLLTKEKALRQSYPYSLAYVAAQHGDIVLIEQLAKYGVNFNAKSEGGVTPLYIASEKGYDKIVAKLIECGADFNMPTDEKVTPLYIAVQEGHEQVVAELAKHGANFYQVGNNGVSLVNIAAYKGHTQVIKEFAKNGFDFNIINADGMTPLYMAAQEGCVEVIAELAKYNVNFNLTDDEGIAPLFVAAFKGHSLAVEELVKHGAEVDQSIQRGLTATFIAAHNGHAPVIEILAKYKADLNKTNDEGDTPAFIAAQRGHPSVILELIKQDVDVNKILAHRTAEQLRVLAGKHGLAVINRMEHFISKHTKNGETMIFVSPSDIAMLLGHHEIMQIIKETEHRKQKIALLKTHIEQLRVHGQDLQDSNTDVLSVDEGRKAVELAKKLEKFVDSFIQISKEPKTISQHTEQLRSDFQQALHRGYQEMSTHRALWKPILANIVLAATAIGLLMIIGKYIASGQLFFMETNRQKSIKRMDSILDSLGSTPKSP